MWQQDLIGAQATKI